MSVNFEEKDYDATTLIERLELFEERVGARLEALSASVRVWDDGDVWTTVRGELHSINGVELENDIILQLVAYDSNGRITSTDTLNIYKGEFFGIEVFELTAQSRRPPIEPTKIRIFPKKG